MKTINIVQNKTLFSNQSDKPTVLMKRVFASIGGCVSPTTLYERFSEIKVKRADTTHDLSLEKGKKNHFWRRRGEVFILEAEVLVVSEKVVPSVPGNNHIRRMTSESCSKGFIRAIGDRTASETLVMHT